MTFPPNHCNLQVCQVRGLGKGFKQIIFYDFNTPMTMKLLSEIITKIEEAGGKVRNCAFDLGNKSILKEWKFEKGNYYMKSPTRTGAKIHLMPDLGHAYKNLKNHTMDSILVTYIHDRRTTLQYEDFVDISEKDGPAHEIRCVHKLHKKMLDAQGSDRQNVSWATKTLSSSVASFMKLNGESDKGDVIEIMDKVFILPVP